MVENKTYAVGIALLVCLGSTALAFPALADDTDMVKTNSPNNISLDIQPVEDGETPINTTEKYEVIVGNASEGITVYDLRISLGQLDGAKFVGFNETAYENPGDAIFSVSEILNKTGGSSEEGPYLKLSSALNTKNFEPAEEIVIATFNVRLDVSDSVSINWAEFNNRVGYSDSSPESPIEYTTQTEQGSEISELQIPEVDVTGNGEPAKDTNGDGLLNDVDGDGDYNIFDVQALFKNIESPQVQENSQFFDFNQDGSVNIFDVQELFNELE